MTPEEFRYNAEMMKKHGLDPRIANVAKDAFMEAERRTEPRYGDRTQSHTTEEQLGLILGLFGGDMNGRKVLDMGCGSSNDSVPFDSGLYSPILSCALSYLGANATGLDLDEVEEEVAEKWGFNYEVFDISRPERYSERKDIFTGNELVVAKTLLSDGLKNPEKGRYDAVGDKGGDVEWETYVKMVNTLKEINGKDAVYFLHIPHSFNFDWVHDYMMHMQKAKDSQEEGNLLNEYCLNEFKRISKYILAGDVYASGNVLTM